MTGVSGEVRILIVPRRVCVLSVYGEVRILGVLGEVCVLVSESY